MFFSPMDLFLFLFLNAEEQSCSWTFLTACFTWKVDRYQTVLRHRLQTRLLDRWMCVLLMEICISIVRQCQSTIYFQVKTFKTKDRKVFFLNLWLFCWQFSIWVKRSLIAKQTHSPSFKQLLLILCGYI